MPSKAGEATSSSLLERARCHDPLAWAKLVDLYSPLLWRWCRRWNLKPDDVEDVCQEVFRAVDGALPRFRRDRPGDSFRGWLRTITRNKVLDFWQRTQVGGIGGSSAMGRLNDLADPNAEMIVEAEDEQEVGILHRRAIQLMRSEFEDRTWQAFWRATIDEEPVEQVAQQLGMSPNAVYLAKSRIRKRLKEVLRDLGELTPD